MSRFKSIKTVIDIIDRFNPALPHGALELTLCHVALLAASFQYFYDNLCVGVHSFLVTDKCRR